MLDGHGTSSGKHCDRFPAPASTSNASPPRLLVREQSDLRPQERSQLDRAGLGRGCRLEAWTSTGSNKALAFGTHGVFRFFGKFPPTIAKHLIEHYSQRAERVLDPMMGSGTTVVEALTAERHVTGRDVSPLSSLLARVKTTPVDRAAANAALDRVDGRRRELPASRVSAPVGLRNPSHWFLDSTLESLGRIRASIDEEPPGPVRELLLVTFAGAVRRVSRATTQQGRLFLDRETALPDAWPTFRDRFRVNVRAVASLPKEWSTTIELELADARAVARRRQTVDLIIAHPPYFNNYKYSSVNSLELAWLGFAPSEIRRSEVRESFKVGKPEKLADYVKDMASVLSNLDAELRPGGTLALMIGDTVLRGAYVPTTAQLLASIASTGLVLELAALRAPRYTEASWVASQRRKGGQVGVALRDFVLVFRKRS